MMRAQHLRVARPSDDLDALVAFYRDALGFEVIGSFEDHAGFDGVMLGHPEQPYHFEFTRERGAHAGRAPSAEHLLVFYLADEAAWDEALARLERAGVAPVSLAQPVLGRARRHGRGPRRVPDRAAPWAVALGSGRASSRYSDSHATMPSALIVLYRIKYNKSFRYSGRRRLRGPRP